MATRSEYMEKHQIVLVLHSAMVLLAVVAVITVFFCFEILKVSHRFVFIIYILYCYLTNYTKGGHKIYANTSRNLSSSYLIGPKSIVIDQTLCLMACSINYNCSSVQVVQMGSNYECSIYLHVKQLGLFNWYFTINCLLKNLLIIDIIESQNFIFEKTKLKFDKYFLLVRLLPY